MNLPDERPGQDLTASLRQEVEAPAAAITASLDLIIGNARGLQLDHLLADLDRMHAASVDLNTFVKKLVQDPSSRLRQDEPLEAFYRGLGHDLRTLLGTIKGYSELLIEDMEGDDRHPLRGDLTRLNEAADRMLARVEALSA